MAVQQEQETRIKEDGEAKERREQRQKMIEEEKQNEEVRRKEAESNAAKEGMRKRMELERARERATKERETQSRERDAKKENKMEVVESKRVGVAVRDERMKDAVIEEPKDGVDPMEVDLPPKQVGRITSLIFIIDQHLGSYS